MRKTIFSAIFFALFTNLKARPDGAPMVACETMIPQHGVDAQTTISPYKITLGAQSVLQGDEIVIRVESDDQTPFRGVFIQARNPPLQYETFGTFLEPEDENFRLASCMRTGDAVTHANNLDKTIFEFVWRAPWDFSGIVFFQATVVQVKEIFWTEIISDPLTVEENLTTLPTTEGNTGDTTEESSETTTGDGMTTTPPPNENLYYDGCSEVKSCFGYPKGCHKTNDCKFALSVKKDENTGTYFFELISFHQMAKYVALGITNVPRMSDGVVLECVRETPDPLSFISWLSGAPNPRGANRAVMDQDLIVSKNGLTEETHFYCLIEIPSKVSYNDIEFDLDNNKYHIIIVAGSQVQENSISYHDLSGGTADKKYLGHIGEFLPPPYTLYKLHGIFMIVAWIGTASIGMVFAQYFKNTIPGQLFGKDVWFICHMFLMITTWILAVVAFILVFVEVGAWADTPNPHPVLGICVMILVFFQPLGGLLRPPVNHLHRPIFKFFHGWNGYFSHILAAITIFYAPGLSVMPIPHYLMYIFTGYLVYYLVLQMCLTGLSITDIREMPYVETSMQGMMKKALMVIHIGITLAVVIALAIIVGLI